MAEFKLTEAVGDISYTRYVHADGWAVYRTYVDTNGRKMKDLLIPRPYQFPTFDVECYVWNEDDWKLDNDLSFSLEGDTTRPFLGALNCYREWMNLAMREEERVVIEAAAKLARDNENERIRVEAEKQKALDRNMNSVEFIREAWSFPSKY
jgi:hypothetical protein